MMIADDDPLYELDGDDEWFDCSDCGGEGVYHDCGEDCCPCLDKEGPPFSSCETCEGVGGFWGGEG